ncbi:MAG: monovalent cation/H+ antiporter subunit D family protein [Deltaproteobacteria bacterium]|nr:monovalent cation/H+ antiporter subunit D family protein [Deltaproteobacteria bacterium]
MTPPEIYGSAIPFYAVMVSLIAMPLILLSSRHAVLREFWTLAASIVKFSLVCLLLPGALAGRIAAFTFWEISPGITLALKADAFGVFFALIASGLWILTSVYSIGYVRGLKERKQTRYFACFAVCLSATIGVAFAANLLTFVFFYEILTIATYPLVIHKETKIAISAGRKYLVYTLTAGVLLIAATAWTYRIAGTLDFRPGGLFGDAAFSPGAITALFLLFLAGVGVKAAVMPLHSWLPAAMVAPTPVSALLHAVAVVKSGVFGVVRVVGFVFGPALMRQFGLNFFLATVAGATILLASLLAYRQDNLKHRLAYSTVGHLSYIVLGAALLSPASLVGGLLHIANHATMKITMFFCAGAIYVRHHKEKISDLDGIGRVMPWTMGAFTLAAIGLAGIPPINGFVSKWQLGLGSLQAGELLPLAVLVLSGLLNAGYFAPVIFRAFLKTPAVPYERGEASYAMVVPLLITALLSLLLGLDPDLFFHFHRLAVSVSGSILGGIGQ